MAGDQVIDHNMYLTEGWKRKGNRDVIKIKVRREKLWDKFLDWLQLWWVNLGWLLSAHHAALTLPTGQSGKLKMTKLMGHVKAREITITITGKTDGILGKFI